MIAIEPKSIQAAIKEIKDRYSSISGDILNQAVSRALNHTASKGKTASNQNIRKTYNISASRINSELKTKSSTYRSLEAQITASGRPLSLNQFQAKQVGPIGTTSFNRKGIASSRLNRKSRTNAIKGVSAIIKKGESINIPTAFIQIANGGITVFARGVYTGDFKFGKERYPIDSITTASIPGMFANDEVINPTINTIDNVLSDRIEHEIRWLMSK